MITKISKFICLTIVMFAVSFVLAYSAMAADNEIKVEFLNGSGSWEFLCEGNVCEKSLFNEANFLPNDVVVRRVRITNQRLASGSGLPQQTVAEAINNTGAEINEIHNLAKTLFIIITKEGGQVVYGDGSSTGVKTLFNFYQDGEINLAVLNDNASAEYDFAITFDPGADNDEWNKKDGDTKIRTTEFNIIFGLQGDGGGDGDDGDDDGDGGGGWIPPGLTIINETDVSGCTTTVISWLTSYFSTSNVIYSTSTGQFNLSAGDPYYGYDYHKEGDLSDDEKVIDHNVELTGLEEGTTYYYRCVSHASPATIGYERSFTTCDCPDEVIVLGEEGAPELTISKTVNADFANSGDTVIYKVNIANIGNMAAYNAVLTDTLPTEFTFIDGGDTSKIWQIGDIEPGQEKSVEYEVSISTAAATGIYANLAQASADNHELISAFVNVNIELAPTGFSVKEFIILILALVALSGSAIILRKKYLQ